MPYLLEFVFLKLNNRLAILANLSQERKRKGEKWILEAKKNIENYLWLFTQFLKKQYTKTVDQTNLCEICCKTDFENNNQTKYLNLLRNSVGLEKEIFFGEIKSYLCLTRGTREISLAKIMFD